MLDECCCWCCGCGGRGNWLQEGKVHSRKMELLGIKFLKEEREGTRTKGEDSKERKKTKKKKESNNKQGKNGSRKGAITQYNIFGGLS